MSQVYLLNGNEVLAGITKSAEAYIGPTAHFCNFIGILETLLDDYFYGALFNKETPVQMLLNYKVPSEEAELAIGNARVLLTNMLNASLVNVPKDRFVNYTVCPMGEIEITDFQINVGDDSQTTAFLDDRQREREWRESGNPPESVKKLIITEINEGAWVPESLKRFAGV